MSRKSDFLSWDEDLNLEEVLGEYTDVYLDDSDSDFASEQSKQVDLKTGYLCPHCGKVLKTIAGFRGHVTKQHQDTTTKAAACKIGGTVTSQSLSSSSSSVEAIPLEDFKIAYDACINTIMEDPILQMLPDAVAAAKFARGHCDLMTFFYNVYRDIVCFNQITLSDCRETMFRKVHQFRVTGAETCDNIFIQSGFYKKEGINAFVQLFSIEIISELVKGQLKSVTIREKVQISDRDQEILYYICGYIGKALRKKYGKIQNVNKREVRLMCLDRALSKNAKEGTHAHRFSHWTTRVSRGGLHHPSDHMFFLVREFEAITRHGVDQENLCANSLTCANLKESLIDSVLVKSYSEDLFSCIIHNYMGVLEDMLTLFLTIRGHAISRHVRNKVQLSKQKSVSLRGGLKDHVIIRTFFSLVYL